jgi:hypothetical protein
MSTETPKPPKGLRSSGRKLRRSVVRDFDLDEHEASVLLQAAKTADLLDDLQALFDRDGPMAEIAGHPVPPCRDRGPTTADRAGAVGCGARPSGRPRGRRQGTAGAGRDAWLLSAAIVRRRQRSVFRPGCRCRRGCCGFGRTSGRGPLGRRSEPGPDAPEASEVEHGWPGGELAQFAEWLDVCRSLPDEPFDGSMV